MDLFKSLNKRRHSLRPLYRTKVLLAITAALSLSSIALHAKAAADETFPVQEHTTDAGLSFWYFHMPDAQRTALFIDWEQEVPLGEGTHPAVADVGVEIMLKGGAGGRSAADIVAAYEDLDGGSGLWVRPRGVSGYIVAPDQHFSKAREIAQQVLTEPAFEQRWFDREHQIAIESAIDDRTNSWGQAWNLAREVTTGDHPYNKFWSFNALDDFKAVSSADVKSWYESSFSSKTATISVAGSLAVETVAKEIDLLFANLPDNVPTKPIAMQKPEARGKTILLHNPEAPKSVVLLAGNFPDNNEANNTALQIGLGVLGAGKNSRLFKKVRSGMGASYGFGANVHDVTQEYRMFEMSGEIETEKLQDALTEIEETYEKFRSSGVGPIEFPVFKRFYKREVRKDLERPVNVAYHLNNGVRYGFSTDYMSNTMQRIDSLNRGRVNSLISESFPAYEDILKLVVSPDDTALDDACVITKIVDVHGCF